MGMKLIGDCEVFKVEYKTNGPAEVTVKFANTKDKDGKWQSTFERLTVWNNDIQGNPIPGAELVPSLNPRDKIHVECWPKTDSWKKGNDTKTKTAWTVTRLAMDGGSKPAQTPDSGGLQPPSDDIPF